MTALGRDAQILQHVIARIGGDDLGRTRLAKIVFLADCEARKLLGRPVSSFQYILDQFGPYDERRFRKALDQLTGLGLVTEEEVDKQNRTVGSGHRIADRVPVPCDLAEVDVFLLDHAIENWGSLPEQQLIELAKRTKPCSRARTGGPLDMEVLDGAEKARLGGVSLETVLESRRCFACGDYKTLEDVWNETPGLDPW